MNYCASYTVLVGIAAVLLSSCSPNNAPGNQSFLQHVYTAEAKQLLQANDDIILIDIRTPEEYEAGFIEGTDAFIDYYSVHFNNRLSELEKDNTYMIYCGSGKRSTKAVSTMQSLGFTKLYNLQGGYGAWLASSSANEL